jgi:long-subunit acyl-CoA synthetase (AMP-forming)
LPVGEVGEIFTRSSRAPANYSYLGAKPIKTVDADYASVGDLGYVDADGYLFLADRRVDQTMTGGANVVPAEVEAILSWSVMMARQRRPDLLVGERGRGRPPLAGRMSTLDEFSSGPGT